MVFAATSDFAVRDEMRVFGAFDYAGQATGDVASEEGIMLVFSRYEHYIRT